MVKLYKLNEKMWIFDHILLRNIQSMNNFVNNMRKFQVKIQVQKLWT